MTPLTCPARLLHTCSGHWRYRDLVLLYQPDNNAGREQGVWEAVIRSLQEDEVRTGKPVLGILGRKARSGLAGQLFESILQGGVGPGWGLSWGGAEYSRWRGVPV